MIKKILIISSLLAVIAIAADKKEEGWKASGRLNAYIQSINVVGGDTNTSDREKTTHVEELNLNFRGPLGKGKAGVETRARTTNDNIQAHGAELLYLKAYYRDKIWNIEAGDVAAALNPYIFSGSVKGAKAVYKSPKKKHAWRYTVITGAKTASWRDLMEDGGDDNPTRYYGAFEARYTFERAKEIALSFAAVDTDFSNDSNSSEIGKRGYGLGIDGKWRFNKYVTLKGRTAFSDGKGDIKNDTSSSSHKALYFKLLTRPALRSVRSNFIYQRVDAGFVSYGGSANDDKEQIENSTTWRINRELRARMDLKYSRNNLDGNATDGTENLYYEALSLTYRPHFLRRSSFDFRVSNKDIDSNTKDNNRKTASVNFNLRQKSGWRYGAGYDYSDNDDNNASSSRTHTIRALLGYRHKLRKDSSYRFTIRPNYQIVENSQDKIGLKLDAGYIYNRRLSADILYMINSTNYDSSSTSNDTQNATYQFRARYKLDAKGRNVLRLLLEKRDIDVDNTPNSTYNEYKGKVSLVMNF